MTNGRHPTLKEKDLIGMPWRVALALQADGWWLRADVIWHKPNAMPSSVRDRPTPAHEHVFLLARSPRYFFDAAAIAEPATGRASGNRARRPAAERGRPDAGAHIGSHVPWGGAPIRNARDVWTVATRPLPAALRETHFASFPLELAERCVLAATPPMTCPACCSPWERVWARTGAVSRREPARASWRKPTKTDSTGWAPASAPTGGFRPTCACPGNDGSGRAVVLDPFAGTGTTLEAALRLGRDAIGIEASPKYAALAERRVAPLLAQERLPV